MRLLFRSTERKSAHVEGQEFVPDNEGLISVPENLGPRFMVLPGFVYVGKRDEGEAHKPHQPKYPKARTGRPEEFPWEDIWIEVCRFIHENGIPTTHAELIQYLQQWCENRYGRQPGDSTLKPKVRKLYGALRPDED